MFSLYRVRIYCFIAVLGSLFVGSLMAAWGAGGSSVIEVGSSSFQQEVLDSEVPVVVDFYATWCGPCKKLAPVYAELAHEFSGECKFVKLDVDQAKDVARRFQVSSLPTLVFIKNGQEVSRQKGSISKNNLRKKVQNHL